MSMIPLNLNQYGFNLEQLKKKEEDRTISSVELLVLDLCHRVDYLERENRRIRNFAKRKER